MLVFLSEKQDYFSKNVYYTLHQIPFYFVAQVSVGRGNVLSMHSLSNPCPCVPILHATEILKELRG